GRARRGQWRARWTSKVWRARGVASGAVMGAVEADVRMATSHPLHDAARIAKRWSSVRPSGSWRAGHDSHPAMEQVRTLNTVVIADSTGVRPVTTTTDLRDLVANLDFCWLDVSVRDEAVRTDVLAQLGLDASDLSWALRFGQSPRMVIDRRGLRAVTWLADAAGDVAEVHVLCSPRGVVTVWGGDPAALEQARTHFADRAAELNKSR